MRQTLFYIPHELFGLPIFGFGWLLAIWAVVAAVVLWRSVRRHGWGPETMGHLPLLVIVAVVVGIVCPAIEKWDEATQLPLGLPIRGYGVMLLLATVAGVGLAVLRGRRAGFDSEVILSLAFWMFIAGIIGARLFYVIQKWPEFYRPGDLLGTLRQMVDITEGGLVVYGSVIGGLGAGLVFLARRKLPLLKIGDVIAPGMLVGLAFGRIGCFLNGCCFGGVCDLPIAVSFPADSPPYLRQEMLGQLHGFTLGNDLAVTYVQAASPAGSAGLKVGDRLAAIHLSPEASLRAAQSLPEMAGQEIKVTRRQGPAISVKVAPPAGENEFLNELGFKAASDGSQLLVTLVEPGSQAARAGLMATDTITEIELPMLDSRELAQGLLRMSRSVEIETADGRHLHWSQPVPPAWSLPVHPTQLYSAINAALLALFLWSVYPFRRRDGEVFAWMITLYPISRIVLEAIRADEPGLFGSPLTISQWVSAGILVLAAALWVHLERQPRTYG